MKVIITRNTRAGGRSLAKSGQPIDLPDSEARALIAVSKARPYAPPKQPIKKARRPVAE